MPRKKISTTVYITPEQNELLKLLHDKTKVPVAEYIRQGIDLVLERERERVPGQLGLEQLRKYPSHAVQPGPSSPPPLTPPNSSAHADAPHPQLLDHRPHRSRQVDPGRPATRRHRGPDPAGAKEPVP